MTSHLTHEDLILAYYDEPGARGEHLDACGECRGELARLAAVLDRVKPAEVPEPDADYESRVWQRLAWRLPAERARQNAGGTRRRSLSTWAAAAAVLAMTLVTAVLVTRRDPAVAPLHTAAAPAASTQQQRDRILLVVVGDHFDESERVLVELTNLTPDQAADFTVPRQRAEDLLASNRIYRRSAVERGEDKVATLLDELEPMLMQIAHAPDEITSEELRKMQKRVETKGLVFKLRVVRADVRATATPQQPTI